MRSPGGLVTIVTALLILIQGSVGRQQRFLREPTDMTVIAGEQVGSVTQYLTQGRKYLCFFCSDRKIVFLKVVLPCRVEDKEGLLQWTKDDFGLGTKRDLPG